MPAFGDILRKLRTEKELSQDSLAELSGVHQANISRYELGRDPGFEEACKLADALGVDLNVFRVDVADLPKRIRVSVMMIGSDGTETELGNIEKRLPK